LVIALLGLFLALRLPLLNLPPFGDEDLFIRDALALGQSDLTGYPILSLLMAKTALLGLDPSQLRWVPFVFSLGVLWLTVLLAGRLAGRRAAIWSALVLAASPLSVSVSTQMLFDGAFVAFCALCVTHLYLQSAGPSYGRAAWCGVAIGCLGMTSYAAFPIVAGLILHSWLTRGTSATIKVFALALAVAAAVFSIYPLLFPAHFHLSMQKPAGTLGNILRIKAAMSASLYGRSFAKAAIFAGPLVFWGLAHGLRDGQVRQRLALPLCVSLTYMVAVMIMVNPDRTVGYWAAVLPFLCIIAGAAAAQCQGAPGDRKPAAATLAVLAALVWITSCGPRLVEPVHPGIRWSLHGLFDFVPIRIFYGPSLAMYLKPAAALLGFLGCASFAALGRFQPRLRSYAVACGLAYGLFYSAEYSYALCSPNLNRVAAAVVRSLQEERPAQPVYLHGYGALACARQGIAVRTFMYDVPLMPSLTAEIGRTGGTVVLLNAPAIGPDTVLRRFLASRARLRRTFSDGGAALAEIWEVARTSPDRRPDATP